ncbi:MAG: hypothetical protein HY319_12670 [Armatimonadetes bacterium]|nr:hypothetical protein [Armatimonadota bacterium]
MWEPFQESTRRGIVQAKEEAHRLNHDYIGTEHLLLGMLAHGDSDAARVLQKQGLGLEAARDQVKQLVGASATSSAEVVFSSNAKGSIERAFAEARALGHNYVSSEHLLLGMMGVPEGRAVKILTNLGIDLGQLRQELTASLPHAGVQQPGPSFLSTTSPVDVLRLEIAALRQEIEQLKRAVEELRQDR